MLKKSFEDVLPKELIDRRKLGLLPPASNWVRGKLNNRLKNNLENLNQYKLFDHHLINMVVNDHVKKKEYNLAKVWSIFSLSEILR